jgi:hypothetical protein
MTTSRQRKKIICAPSLKRFAPGELVMIERYYAVADDQPSGCCLMLDGYESVRVRSEKEVPSRGGADSAAHPASSEKALGEPDYRRCANCDNIVASKNWTREQLDRNAVPAPPAAREQGGGGKPQKRMSNKFTAAERAEFEAWERASPPWPEYNSAKSAPKNPKRNALYPRGAPPRKRSPRSR